MSSTTPAAEPTAQERASEDGQAVPMRTLLAACAAAAAVSTPPKHEEPKPEESPRAA